MMSKFNCLTRYPINEKHLIFEQNAAISRLNYLLWQETYSYQCAVELSLLDSRMVEALSCECVCVCVCVCVIAVVRQARIWISLIVAEALSCIYIVTCVSVTPSSAAILARSLNDKYFFCSNCFSSSKICRPVNVVRAFFFLSSPPLPPAANVDPLPPPGLAADVVAEPGGVEQSFGGRSAPHIDGCRWCCKPPVSRRTPAAAVGWPVAEGVSWQVVLRAAIGLPATCRYRRIYYVFGVDENAARRIGRCRTADGRTINGGKEIIC